MPRILALCFCFLVACSQSNTLEENIQVAPKGGKAHWVATDFPMVLLVPDTLPKPVVDSITKAIIQINTLVGGYAMVIQIVDHMDARLNGGITYGSHTIVYEKDRDGWRASTDLTYIEGDLGDVDGRLFSAETSLNDSTPQKFMDKVMLHELLHNWGFSHSDSKDNIMYISAEESTGKISDFEIAYMKKQFQGLL